MDFHCAECERWAKLMEELNQAFLRGVALPADAIKPDPSSIALARQEIATFYARLGIDVGANLPPKEA